MEATGRDEVDKLKTKFMSAWNNMKYSWVLKTKTYFSRNSPVLLLGKCYHFKSEEENDPAPVQPQWVGENEPVVVSGNVEEFRRDFISRIWLTYREEFPQIEGSALTTDCGWGCTLRTGQMLLAQGLILHFLGRAWTWPDALDVDNSDSESWTSHTVKKLTASLEASLTGERAAQDPSPIKEPPRRGSDDGGGEESCHRKIVSWFADSPLACFGLHQLIEHGKKSGKTAGDWYGPAVVAHILRKAVEEARHPDLQGITIYVAQDCTVYKADVIDKQCSSMDPENTEDKAVIILVPVRLGGERTNMDYLEFVKSFHCPSPKKMSFRKMDPSCTVGFYCRNIQDFERASEEITKVLKASSREKYPLFTFVKGHARDYDFTCTPTNEDDLFSEDEKKRLKRFSTEEFVLL
ncbi:cysteine protease ATG4C isoform X2 [Sarcophilus harrisii]|uniref:cysteine protease ATG4C isoform X2 n=1 Tax=Sarcophilus harrisii TaxID=9305 RepID=UPI00062B56ED|nr:cysteine protease ATG4C isoform X2 [Sarcophilus harrisii]